MTENDVAPMSPTDVKKHLDRQIEYPSKVIEAFNECLIEMTRKNENSFTVTSFIDRIILKTDGNISRESIDAIGFLYIFEIFNAVGWNITVRHMNSGYTKYMVHPNE